ncbi:pentatricopeptide repeat (PPR) superfamily protein isoform X2 [Tasmannia lanceolata]|uniref:pentatricopeptide repeat (PPR) superfamily protein isoform X2 n=1 Tax=Tasmannia lanceolata TaxID=3420 RepID=UPI0040629A57
MTTELLQASCISYHHPKSTELGLGFLGFSRCKGFLPLHKAEVFPAISVKVRRVRGFECWNENRLARRSVSSTNAPQKKAKDQGGKKEHHLWMKRDSAGSGQKALNLVRIVSKLPNEKEVIYGALDKWTAWETEFPLVAAAKALGILRKRNQWLRIIQVAKWLLSKGQALTMGTYDTLLLAFDMDGRVDEAESIWNMVLQLYTRSVSKRLFSRIISLYDHHHLPEKVLEVFADMEELGVKPDEDTVRRVGCAFQKLGQEDKQKQLLKKYERKWKYLHFNGERVRVRSSPAGDE